MSFSFRLYIIKEASSVGRVCQPEGRRCRIDIRNISMGHIQYFLKVVECNSFTKAANRLHLTQSTISKSIASMEAMLGMRLFDREKQSIRLTPAGRHLYEKWSGIVALVETAVEEAHVVQQGFVRHLAVGGLDSHRPDIFSLPTVAFFQKKYPDISIRVDNGSAREIRQMLVDRELDVILTVLYDTYSLVEEQFHREILYECPLEACMLKVNPLSEKAVLSVADLKTSNFIAISPLRIPSYTEMLRSLCEPYDFTPHFSCYTSNANALSLNLISGNDIFLCDRFYRDYGNSHLCFRPIENTRSGLVMCWRKDDAKRELKLFVEEVLSLWRAKRDG